MQHKQFLPQRLQPVFPILIYNGDAWTAPDRFRKLMAPSEIPAKYLPEFRYYKIAINEIPKRQLIELRNALAAVFYIENSTPLEIEQNHSELIELLKYIFKYEGAQIVYSIVCWMRTAQKVTLKPKQIKNIQDLMAVSSMWESAVKRHEEVLVKKGIEQGILIDKKNILIDQFTIKFSKSATVEKKIRSARGVTKLEKALRVILFEKHKDENLKCL